MHIHTHIGRAFVSFINTHHTHTHTHTYILPTQTRTHAHAAWPGSPSSTWRTWCRTRWRRGCGQRTCAAAACPPPRLSAARWRCSTCCCGPSCTTTRGEGRGAREGRGFNVPLPNRSGGREREGREREGREGPVASVQPGHNRPWLPDSLIPARPPHLRLAFPSPPPLHSPFRSPSPPPSRPPDRCQRADAHPRRLQRHHPHGAQGAAHLPHLCGAGHAGLRLCVLLPVQVRSGRVGGWVGGWVGCRQGVGRSGVSGACF